MDEVRDFKMHQKLLADVITRQAGTLEKAVLEGVMNSIEAGATRIEILLERQRLRISDNGKGFQSQAEIEKWFEVFGQPHEESEGKRWAQFRMGRGQLFAFGKNTWSTNRWRMEVDVRERLGYKLMDLFKPFKGCEILVELYETVSESAVSWTARQVERQVKYTGIDISVNETKVGRDPAKEKWGPETGDDAYIKLGVGRNLEVYNLGVYVCDIPESRFGATGILVSKKQLKVNFARNEVCSDCPVWARLRKVLKSESQVDALLRKKVLSEGERSNLVERLVSGELTIEQVWKSPLLVDVCGHTHSFYSISDWRGWKLWSYTDASDKDLRADVLVQTKQCLVLDKACVEEFQFAVHTLSQLFLHKWPSQYGERTIGADVKYVDYETIAKSVDDEHALIPDKEWTLHERLWVETLESLLYYSEKALDQRKKAYSFERRRICMGRSTGALAWTDGKTYVAFARHYLKKLQLLSARNQPHVGHVTNAALTLLHECCHDGDSLKDKHSPQFHKEYHDASFVLTDGISHVCNNYLNVEKLEKTKARLLKAVRKAEPATTGKEPVKTAARVSTRKRKLRKGEVDI